MVSALGKYLEESGNKLKQVDSPSKKTLWKIVESDDGTFEIEAPSGKFLGLKLLKNRKFDIALMKEKSDNTKFNIFRSLITRFSKKDDFTEGKDFEEIMSKL